MSDVFDRQTRSRIMRAIRGRDTKPELALAVALRVAGIRFRRQVRIGRFCVDFVIRHDRRRPFDLAPLRLVVLVHGCYWHSCPQHFKPPSGEGFRRKLQGNVRRDLRARRLMRRLGYGTMVVWEHESPRQAAARVRRRLLSGR